MADLKFTKKEDGMSNTVTEAVAEKITKIMPEVHDAVVEVMVAREKKKRADALVSVMDQLEKLEKDFKKLGPDQAIFDADGNKTSESFSKARADERKKASEKIQKYINTINKALKGDFGDVYNLANQKAESQD